MRKIDFNNILKVVTTFSFLLFTIIINGQTECNNTAIDSYIENEENLSGVMKDGATPGINYMNPDWRKGEVVLEEGKTITNIYLNYNLIAGTLTWLRTVDFRQVTLDIDKVNQFTIYKKDNNDELKFKKTYFSPWYKTSSSDEYLHVLAEGYVRIYAYRKAHFNVTSDELIKTDEYYYQFINGKLSNFMLRRYILYKMVGKEDKPILRKIIRTNHLRIRKEKDMIKAMILFNKEKSGS